MVILILELLVLSLSTATDLPNKTRFQGGDLLDEFFEEGQVDTEVLARIDQLIVSLVSLLKTLVDLEQGL